MRIGWDSPIKEVVHPKFINLESRGGLGWIEGFNEWMARCGLEYAGHPGKDEFITNTGDKGQMDSRCTVRQYSGERSDGDRRPAGAAPPRARARG